MLSLTTAKAHLPDCGPVRADGAGALRRAWLGLSQRRLEDFAIRGDDTGRRIPAAALRLEPRAIELAGQPHAADLHPGV
ncbi:MAG: hypothetical protein U0074_02725 [Kouleothrix sp.]